MAQQIVEEQVCSTFILVVSEYDITLSALCHGSLEEVLLMTKEDVFLVRAGLQRTDACAHMVAKVLREFMDAEGRFNLNALRTSNLDCCAHSALKIRISASVNWRDVVEILLCKIKRTDIVEF